jgi:hypothetical protein
MRRNRKFPRGAGLDDYYSKPRIRVKLAVLTAGFPMSKC